MTNKHRQVLERRLLYLDAQIAVRTARGQLTAYEQAEAAALRAALAALEDAAEVGLTRLGKLTVTERHELREALAAVAVAS